MQRPSRQLVPSTFPPLLREIADPPEALYIKGELPLPDLHHLCVVGSRKSTPYGREVCETLIKGLRGFPIVIVSGLALGTDACAHQAALDAGLTTVAVPGSGLNPKVLYPRSNYRLAERILREGGALVSEFPDDYAARPESFPRRNRIMAGLSHAVLIIEAEQRSGTMITARLATEYNRDVLTVPGSIFTRSSDGPHLLIRLGATLVRTPEDILEALGIVSEDKPATIDTTDCTPEEIRVLALLATPLAREELIVHLDMSASEANVLLSTMELKGLITERMGKLHLA